MTVVYRLDRTGRTEHEVVEVLLTERCPSCGARWVGEHHRATKVDELGRPVASPGWGLAQEQRGEGGHAAR